MDKTTSPQDFRKNFHNPNLPCLIDFQEDENSPFRYVNKHWRTANTTTTTQKVNRNWFLKMFGPNTLVPLRYYPQNESFDLDTAGRAKECETKEVTLQEWVQLLEGTISTEGDDQQDHSYYLKDWHLQMMMLDQPLYSCPDIFQMDLLNPFLIQFTKGDYRFCYWGPPKSKTMRHSDVMHSFSWSYNVIGTKRWTFYREESELDDDEKGWDQFSIIQRAGQAIFVPCNWQHEVENIEETISINHNWITVANIDQTWECILGEMDEVDKELKSWGIAKDDNLETYLESSESMLRGCVGLNVTAFFAMILVRLLELLELATTKVFVDDDDFDELSFDCCRLVEMIQLLMEDEAIELNRRIEIVVQSKSLAQELCELGLLASTLVCISDQ